MNTSEVSKLLGVSSSTIQRWVKQLELPMERNERGHYFFKDGDITILKKIQEQIQNGALIQDIAPIQEKKPRRGTVKAVENDQAMEKLFAKVRELEISLNDKADSVASYQLLQHRREIEELQSQVKALNLQLETLQKQVTKLSTPVQTEVIPFHNQKKPKKKNIVSMLFGF